MDPDGINDSTITVVDSGDGLRVEAASTLAVGFNDLNDSNERVGIAPVAVKFNDSTVRKQAWYRFGFNGSTVCSATGIAVCLAEFNDSTVEWDLTLLVCEGTQLEAVTDSTRHHLVTVGRPQQMEATIDGLELDLTVCCLDTLAVGVNKFNVLVLVLVLDSAVNAGASHSKAMANADGINASTGRQQEAVIVVVARIARPTCLVVYHSLAPQTRRLQICRLLMLVLVLLALLILLGHLMGMPGSQTLLGMARCVVACVETITISIGIAVAVALPTDGNSNGVRSNIKQQQRRRLYLKSHPSDRQTTKLKSLRLIEERG